MVATGRRDVPRRLLAGFAEGGTWRAAGYVFVSFLTTLMLFVFVAAVVLPSVIACLVGIGIVTTLGATSLLDRLVDFERRRAGWVSLPVLARPFESRSLIARFRDPNRWRLVGFGSAAWLVALFAFLGVVLAWTVPLYLLSIPVWGWAIESFSVVEIVGQALAGAGLLLLAPWITVGVARGFARFVESSVGPDRLALMERQVADATENRDQILVAVAGERRRIERNLHDGVQQQLVALGIDIGLAQAKLDSDPEAARRLLADASRKTHDSIGELRALGRGLHPAILEDRGLDAALSGVVANAPIPIDLHVSLDPAPSEHVAEAVYFVVNEAVANIMKHSRARVASIDVQSTSASLQISVHDDGIGGAGLTPNGASTGTGLAGIAARVRALGGTFEVLSPTGGPTDLRVALPPG